MRPFPEGLPAAPGRHNVARGFILRKGYEMNNIMESVETETEAKKKLYVIDYNWLKVEEYEIVKETPRRIYYKAVGSWYDGGYYFYKYKWFGPNKNLFTDPLEAYGSLDGLIAKKIADLQEQQRRVEKQRQAIRATRPGKTETGQTVTEMPAVNAVVAKPEEANP
jgi:hypothetical protein